MEVFHYFFQGGCIFDHILSTGGNKKNRSNQEIKDSATPHIHLNNPCEAGAKRCQGGVDLWFDIAMKSAHYLKPICLHIENRELDNLLIFFQGFTYQGFLSSSCRIKDEATTLLLLLVLYIPVVEWCHVGYRRWPQNREPTSVQNVGGIHCSD